MALAWATHASLKPSKTVNADAVVESYVTDSALIDPDELASIAVAAVPTIAVSFVSNNAA